MKIISNKNREIILTNIKEIEDMIGRKLKASEDELLLQNKILLRLYAIKIRVE